MRNSALAVILLCAAAVLPARAQDYPTKTVHIVVPFPPGSLTDTLARLVGEKLQGKWGSPVIVENRPGASGNIGTDFFAKAAPDGYTLLFAPTSPFVTNRLLYQKLPYDPEAFVLLSVVALAPEVLMVRPGIPAKTVQELIAFAKANPGKLNYASSGMGGLPHLTAELLGSMAGIQMVNVPYQGTAPALTALLAGQVDILFDAVGVALPSIRAGKLRALAVGSEKRYPELPDVPAMTEVLPGFVSMVWVGMAAPPKTPPALASRISTAIGEVTKQSEVSKRMLELSFVAIGGTQAEMATLIKQEMERWGNVIRVTGVKAE